MNSCKPCNKNKITKGSLSCIPCHAPIDSILCGPPGQIVRSKSRWQQASTLLEGEGANKCDKTFSKNWHHVLTFWIWLKSHKGPDFRPETMVKRSKKSQMALEHWLKDDPYFGRVKQTAFVSERGREPLPWHVQDFHTSKCENVDVVFRWMNCKLTTRCPRRVVMWRNGGWCWNFVIFCYGKPLLKLKGTCSWDLYNVYPKALKFHEQFPITSSVGPGQLEGTAVDGSEIRRSPPEIYKRFLKNCKYGGKHIKYR